MNASKKNARELPQEEHFCDRQLEIHPLIHMMSHIMTAQTPMTHGKPLCGTAMHCLVVVASHLTFHFVALVSQDAATKVTWKWINWYNIYPTKAMIVWYTENCPLSSVWQLKGNSNKIQNELMLLLLFTSNL